MIKYPNPEWTHNMLTLRDLFGLTFPQARDVLEYFQQDVEAAFEVLSEVQRG